MPRRIPVQELKPGMRLAKPVENSSGMVLLGENTELTIEFIDKIKNMGIGSVSVQGSYTPAVPCEELLADLDRRFDKIQNEPYMDTLKRILQEHIKALYDAP